MRCGKGVRAARAQRRRQVHRYQDPDHVGPLVLDEPTTGLDPEARAALWQEIGDLASSGMTILLTTRYLEEADRLTIVDKGTVIVDGTPDELKGSLRGDAVHIELDTKIALTGEFSAKQRESHR